MSIASDNVYYNIEIINNTSFKPATFADNRVVEILKNPAEYELSVVRFSIPAQNIPVMVWNNNYQNFAVTMRFGGSSVTHPLVWIPNSNQAILDGRAVWSYQHFLNMINVALQSCFTDIKIAQPTAPPTEAPYMTIENELITFHAQQLYDVDGPPTIQVIVSESLNRIMPSLSTIGFKEGASTLYRLVVRNYRNNIDGAYYKMTEEYNSLALWNDAFAVLFETDAIPVEPEGIGSQNNVVRRVLTDFEPLSDINNRQTVQFFPQGPIRYYSLTSKYPLREINMRVFIEYRNGEVYPLFIGKGDVVTMKILFRKRIPNQLEVLWGNE